MPDVVPVKIRAIKRVPTQPVYDIQVKKNHNFFANGLLVHNCIIFQEQVMELAEKVAGFPKEQCDEVRRAIMKRSISGGEAAKKAAQETREGFVKGCVKNGYTETVANNLYDKILYFAGYGFNKCFTAKEKVAVQREGTNEVLGVEIQHIKPGDRVLSRDESTGQTIFIAVKHLHNNGYNEVIRLELTSGEVVECTLNHKFRTVETGEMLPLWAIREKGLSIVVNDAVLHSRASSGLTSTFLPATVPSRGSSHVKRGSKTVKKTSIGSFVACARSKLQP